MPLLVALPIPPTDIGSSVGNRGELEWKISRLIWYRSHRNRRREELTSTHQFPLTQAVRYRYLAAKARREASAVSGDPIAPRLIELAEKLEGDAVRDEEEARILLAEQGKATPLPQLDRELERGPNLWKARQAAGGQQP